MNKPIPNRVNHHFKNGYRFECEVDPIKKSKHEFSNPEQWESNSHHPSKIHWYSIMGNTKNDQTKYNQENTTLLV